MKKALIIIVVWVIAQEAPAENWPRFRGPNGSRVAAGAKIPAGWSDSNYRWKIDLPGIGHGSPVVWGDRVFLLAASEPPPRPKRGNANNNAAARESAVLEKP